MGAAAYDLQFLRGRWEIVCGSLGTEGDVDGVFERLVSLYSEPSRYYHNHRHIQECLELCRAYSTLEDGEDAVAMALFFHDAIYDATHSDNERRSAELAWTELQALGVDVHKLDAVRRLILITRHQDVPMREDEKLIVDVDLAILGAPPERFDEYERQIRAEYAHVPDDAFRAGRAAVLRKLLARETIYSTERMRRDFEQRARENLGRSIERLTLPRA